LPRRGHEPPLGLWLQPLGLAAGGLLLGVWPGPLARTLIGPAAASAIGAPQTVKLALWHGVNWALGLSAFSLALGGLAYWTRRTLRRPSESPLFTMGPARWYDVPLQAVYRLADTPTSLLRTGAPAPLKGYPSFAPNAPGDTASVQDMAELKDELGDLLLHVAFHVQIAQEHSSFTLQDVLNSIYEKIVRRRGLSARLESFAISTASPLLRKRILPDVGSIRRRIVLPAVVLPQPDSPTRPSVSP